MAHARRIRVGMLLDTLVPGGAETIAVEVACALDRERFEPFVVATRRGGSLEAQLDRGQVAYTILGRRGKWPPVRTAVRAHRLFLTADLIHAHMFGSSMWGALIARTTGVPLVTRDPTWSGERSVVRTSGYRHWIAPVADTIICPSHPVAASIQDEGVPASKLEVIPNGVRTGLALPPDAARAELGLDADAWVIGIIAHLREEKAHDVLLRAFAQLRRGGRPATLCIVGDGPCSVRLRALARELAIDEHVVWAGARREARRLASAFDVAVICSNWEGLPLAALEILAAGTPLVATRVGVLPEILRDGAGVLVAVGSADGLAHELGTLMDDPDRARLIARRGLARVHDAYRFDDMVARFADVYEATVENASRGRTATTRGGGANRRSRLSLRRGPDASR